MGHSQALRNDEMVTAIGPFYQLGGKSIKEFWFLEFGILPGEARKGAIHDLRRIGPIKDTISGCGCGGFNRFDRLVLARKRCLKGDVVDLSAPHLSLRLAPVVQTKVTQGLLQPRPEGAALHGDALEDLSIDDPFGDKALKKILGVLRRFTEGREERKGGLAILVEKLGKRFIRTLPGNEDDRPSRRREDASRRSGMVLRAAQQTGG
jgi:hypothetical protein